MRCRYESQWGTHQSEELEKWVRRAKKKVADKGLMRQNQVLGRQLAGAGALAWGTLGPQPAGYGSTSVGSPQPGLSPRSWSQLDARGSMNLDGGSALAGQWVGGGGKGDGGKGAGKGYQGKGGDGKGGGRGVVEGGERRARFIPAEMMFGEKCPKELVGILVPTLKFRAPRKGLDCQVTDRVAQPFLQNCLICGKIGHEAWECGDDNIIIDGKRAMSSRVIHHRYPGLMSPQGMKL